MRRLALMLGFVAAACGGGDAGEGRVWRVAVVPKGTVHEFWKAVEQGALRADSELEDLEIVWKGPQGEGDATAQIAVVESFLAERYAGICLAPLDARALLPSVRQAVAAGVPVVIFDSALAGGDAGIVSYVATDNRRGGGLAAQRLVELLDGKGDVVLMRYLVGSESTEQREAGFLAELARHPGMRLLSAEKHGGPDEARAVEVGENLLATYGEHVEGIFCPNESCASGMLTALRRDPRGLLGRVKLVGFDSSPNIVQGLREGGVHGTVLQDPVRMGYEAVRAMRARLRGDRVPARIETGEILATPENLDEPRIGALLEPLRR